MKKNIRHILIAMLCLLWIAQARSQPPSKFYTRFGGSGYDFGYDVKQTFDKGYIITGSTSSFGQGNTDLYLVKLDSMGVRQWEKSFGNYNNETGKSVVQLSSDSGYVMAGYTNSTGFGGYDVYMVKADKNGNLVWEHTFGGSDWDFAYSLKETSDGGFVMCGTTYSFGRGQADGYIIRTNSLGVLQWNKTYGGTNDDEFKSIIQTSDGGFALAGYTKSYADVNGDAWVFKLNAAGDSAYSQSIGGLYDDYFSNVIQLLNKSLCFVGSNKSQTNGQNSVSWRYSIDTLNNPVFNTYIMVTHDERYNAIALGYNGTIGIVGYNNFLGTLSDGLIHLYTPSFSFLNWFPFGMDDNDDIVAIDKTRDKGFVAIGNCSGNNSKLEDVFIVKCDSIGNVGTNITGVQENPIQDNNFKVYPNPCSDYIIVKKQNTDLLHVKLFSITGLLLFDKLLDSKENVIDLGEYNSGVYILQFSNGDAVLHNKKITILKP